MDRIPTNSKMTPSEQEEYRVASQNHRSSLQVRASLVSFSSIGSSNPSPFSSNSRTPTPHPFFSSHKASSTSLGSLGYRGTTTGESDSEDEAPVDLRIFRKMSGEDENLPPILCCSEIKRSDSAALATEEDLEGLFCGLGIELSDLFGEPTPKNPKSAQKARPIIKRLEEMGGAGAAPVMCGKRREMEGIEAVPAIKANDLSIITGKKRTAISEGEFDPDTQKALPFQTTYTKKHTHSEDLTQTTTDAFGSNDKKRRNADPSYETIGSSFNIRQTLARPTSFSNLSQFQDGPSQLRRDSSFPTGANLYHL